MTKGIHSEKEKYYDDDNIHRDLELENIVGNLTIAEYQVDRLQQRLSEHVRGVRYRPFNSMKSSAHTFKYDGKWYKLSIKVEELSLDSSRHNDSVEPQK